LIRSLFLLLIYLSFLGLGVAAPFVFTLGYAWVDTFRPQAIAFIILNQIPVALIMGLAALFSYVAMDRRSPPRLTAGTLLTILMACWVSTTIIWAEVPQAAWQKWDWAFKTVMFSAFVPLVIRSRVQIEAFVQTYVFSLAANFVAFGLKVLISGGGYGRNLGLESGNSNLAEGGLLSTICLMAIPLALHLGRHSLLMPRTRLTGLAYVGLAGLCLVTALGTFERSALIGMVVLGAYMFIRSRNKVGFGIILAIVAAAVAYKMSASWTERISTVTAPVSDESALTRLLVWKWTLAYAATHPLGGGFQAFLVDRIVYPDGLVVFGRAFHSIYFEVLGEQGWVGLGLFLGLAGWTFFGLRRLSRRVRNLPELAWAADLSDALQSGLAVFMASGAFVGIAFQPAFWYFIAMSVSLREYVRRVEHPVPAPGGWRTRTLPATAGAPAVAVQPWRQRTMPGRPGR
jgi:probable O-glycosylation ligase (exosortase A-associated)